MTLIWGGMYGWDAAVHILHGPLHSSRVLSTPESLMEIMKYPMAIISRGVFFFLSKQEASFPFHLWGKPEVGVVEAGGLRLCV